jgi:hypothetical protein
VRRFIAALVTGGAGLGSANWRTTARSALKAKAAINRRTPQAGLRRLDADETKPKFSPSWAGRFLVCKHALRLREAFMG